MTRIEVHARWRVLDQRDRMMGWRGWLAERLRALATRLDGLTWHAILCDSSPRLTDDDASDCLVAGLEHGGRLWAELAKERAQDLVLREIHPELY
jgi:hypothetical protein